MGAQNFYRGLRILIFDLRIRKDGHSVQYEISIWVSARTCEYAQVSKFGAKVLARSSKRPFYVEYQMENTCAIKSRTFAYR